MLGSGAQPLAAQDQDATLESTRTSIFHATGSVFVFMQISQAARWAKAGSVIHHQAVPSSAALPAAKVLQAGLSCGLSSHSDCTVDIAPS